MKDPVAELQSIKREAKTCAPAAYWRISEWLSDNVMRVDVRTLNAAINLRIQLGANLRTHG